MPNTYSQEPIRDLADDCVAKLKSLLGKLDSHLLEKAEKQVDRLDLLAANIGIFDNQEFSLDYRLREDPDISDVVCNMIKVVITRVDFVIDPSKDDTKPVHSDTSMFREKELDAIARTIGRLHRLSLSIRRAKRLPSHVQSPVSEPELETVIYSSKSTPSSRHKVQHVSAEVKRQLHSDLGPKMETPTSQNQVAIAEPLQKNVGEIFKNRKLSPFKTEVHASDREDTSVNNSWTWSDDHQDFYRCTLDGNGQYVYEFARQGHVQFVRASQTMAQDMNSGAAQHNSSYRHTQNPEAASPSYPNQAQSYAYSHNPTNASTSYQLPESSDTKVTQAYYLPSYGQSHREDQTSTYKSMDMDVMPTPVPPHIRSSLPNLISGTPNKGFYEPLDPSYRMRTDREAVEFFRMGRVFSTIWGKSASETAVRQVNPDGEVANYNDAMTLEKFGQPIFCQIRRFVIMKVRRNDHFVYACPITTYSGRATLKYGCNPADHTIVHFSGTNPTYLRGEYERGMTKEPIAIMPTDQTETMEPTSRLRFGKTYPVEWNVKVKDIGIVDPRHMSKLLRYWKESDLGDEDDEGIFAGSQTTTQNAQVLATQTHDTHHYPSSTQYYSQG